ncbi:Zn-dependent protease [Nitrosospira sp. Nsp5]|jgi:Zn-dependent protease|uniref:Zn-dependent protease (Includes SpoIVFB) n=1 Tax=Nitrosospira multiformis TaxID=1231 RepID=A0ABY0TLS2_9PROT|nr:MULTISPECIES: site-2 protease family protein [Nitrosospira]PTR09928.1 Zn-dependent protease [Nitrosospira sp. Nsp5]SCX92969.1 Zn-dependent protease (includes SpoIVFB) [Nitrosospira sp. Nsp13]SDR01160.1 Zn-dependent protease (includes SpoIVFB) [Nitrosospira multiformis]
MDSVIQNIAIYALPVIFAITLHEAAHGYVAKHFGDLTAYAQGRVSLNPIRHIDPVGTILLPLLTLLLGGILFGWAKPVPVNFSALRHPKQDMLWVALAGPGANLFMALLWAFVIKLGISLPESDLARPMILMGEAGIKINVILMVLNLLPLPPLDGGRIAVSLLPHNMAYGFSKIEPYGFMILLLLLITGVLGAIIGPFISITIQLVVWFFGLEV